MLPSVPGGRSLALAAAPVCALRPAGGPLGPLRPAAIHCKMRQKTYLFAVTLQPFQVNCEANISMQNLTLGLEFEIERPQQEIGSLRRKTRKNLKIQSRSCCKTAQLGNFLMFQCGTLSVHTSVLINEYFTWAQRGTCHPLEGRALAKGSPVQRGRIGAAARSPLPAPPTPSVALRPLGPRRPASAYWWRVKKMKRWENLAGEPPDVGRYTHADELCMKREIVGFVF